MALRNGSRFAVSMHEVFPHGCHLVPDSITEAQDYDEKTRRRTPSVDKVTGKRVFSCRVVDMDPELEGRSRETVVKILADRMPVAADPGAVRAGRVRRAAGHPVRDRPGPDGVLAARDRDQGRRPAGGQGRGLMPARRVTTRDAAGGHPLGGGVRGLHRPDSAADDHGRPARAAGDPDPARADRGRARPVRPRARRPGRPVRGRGRAHLPRACPLPALTPDLA